LIEISFQSAEIFLRFLSNTCGFRRKYHSLVIAGHGSGAGD